MENDIIYFSDFPNLQETGTRKDNGKFDLTLLPTQTTECGNYTDGCTDCKMSSDTSDAWN